MSTPIRLAIIDDHPFVQAGIRTYLSTEPDITIVGTGINATDAESICRTVRPDVMILDLYMPGSSAKEIIGFARQHCPETKILVFSAFNDPATIQSVISTGIAGYVLKEESPDLLLHAIRTVVKGATWFSRSILNYVVAQPSARLGFSPHQQLSEREWDILQGIAQGWSNARIAETLHLAEQTVRNYTGRIYDVIGVRSRTEAVLWAIENNVLES